MAIYFFFIFLLLFDFLFLNLLYNFERSAILIIEYLEILQLIIFI